MDNKTLRRTAVRRMVAAGVAVLLTSGVLMPTLLWAATCTIDVGFINRKRFVPGNVDEECGPGHTPPWGNWGVTSNVGGRRNADQFAGWKRKGGHRQWNSCTTDYPWRNTDPDHEDFYNHPLTNYQYKTEQRSDPMDEQHYASHRFTGPIGVPCDEVYLSGVYTSRDIYMHLYELDAGGIFGGADDKITKLRYGDIHVPISCTGAWACEGRSAWTWPIEGHSDVTAQVQIRMRLYRR